MEKSSTISENKESVRRNYLVKIYDSWKLIEAADSMKDLVVQVATHTGNNTRLFQIAISACPESDCIQMYNQFVEVYKGITGVWELSSHIFGDEI